MGRTTCHTTVKCKKEEDANLSQIFLSCILCFCLVYFTEMNTPVHLVGQIPLGSAINDSVPPPAPLFYTFRLPEKKKRTNAKDKITIMPLNG